MCGGTLRVPPIHWTCGFLFACLISPCPLPHEHVYWMTTFRSSPVLCPTCHSWRSFVPTCTPYPLSFAFLRRRRLYSRRILREASTSFAMLQAVEHVTAQLHRSRRSAGIGSLHIRHSMTTSVHLYRIPYTLHTAGDSRSTVEAGHNHPVAMATGWTKITQGVMRPRITNLLCDVWKSVLG